MSKNMSPLESVEQKRFILLARNWLPKEMRKLLFAIPNGGKRNIITAKNLKLEGVVAGVPDIFFDWPRLGYHGLRIEMKRVKGGSLTAEQKEMISLMIKAGYCVKVCKGHVAALKVLKQYMLDIEQF